jgi:hypothetical protein
LFPVGRLCCCWLFKYADMGHFFDRPSKYLIFRLFRRYGWFEKCRPLHQSFGIKVGVATVQRRSSYLRLHINTPTTLAFCLKQSKRLIYLRFR